MANKPKIFAIKQVDPELGCIGFALAEDGTGLVEYLSTNAIYARHDLGLTSSKQHELYREKYPHGYELVDYLDATDEELAADPVFTRAYAINHGDDEVQP